MAASLRRCFSRPRRFYADPFESFGPDRRVRPIPGVGRYVADGYGLYLGPANDPPGARTGGCKSSQTLSHWAIA